MGYIAEIVAGESRRMANIDICAPSPSLRGMRRSRVENFGDYLIFYRPVDRGIEVVRVIHGARDIEALFE